MNREEIIKKIYMELELWRDCPARSERENLRICGAIDALETVLIEIGEKIVAD
jgi:hypothetical protein